jgi:predicted RNA-binding Zn-ribbon protein involved in translation (DUF1610 family)
MLSLFSAGAGAQLEGRGLRLAAAWSMTGNTLVRSEPCPDCGEAMLWTQNAWRSGTVTNAAYQCSKGHVIDPAQTRQCPACGLHDTKVVTEDEAGRQQCQCLRCGNAFQVPR